jgi:hypothetical protein
MKTPGSDDALEYPAKDIALPKPMQPVLRKCRVVWNLVIKVEPAEPTVSQVQLGVSAFGVTGPYF